MSALDRMTESERRDVEQWWLATLRACVQYNGDIATCWADMVWELGREHAWLIYDQVRQHALANGDDRVKAWAENVSGVKQ